MAQTISTKGLKSKIDSDDSFYLVDVLSENSFTGRHIPEAINVPGSESFVEDFEKKTGAKSQDEIIVYCTSETCGASPAAAKQLEEAGYKNVSHYKSGLAGWEAAGFDFEGEIEED